jgi:putative ABC transport system permease protein
VKYVRAFLSRLWAVLRSRQMDRDIDDEIAGHLAEARDEYIQGGLSPEDAHRAALRSFGGVTQSKEVYRQIRSFMWLDDLMRDVRYALRTLRRSPGFAAVAIFTLALGIGATTAMFSVVNGVLLRPLPYPEQDRLIEIVHEAPGIGANALFASPAIYFGYRDYGRVFEAVGLWDWDSSPVTVTGAGEPESVTSLEVTREVLPILGATPIVGRTFGEADDRPGSAPTAVISYGYWQRRFGGADPVGQTLVVDGVARQIVGVLPQSFRFFDYPADIFYPMQLSRADAVFPLFDGKAIARLKSGVTLAQANADAAHIIPILTKEFAPRGADLGRLSAELARLKFAPRFRWLKDAVVGDLRETLWILMGTIGLLLLIACANVANLVLVRTHSRQPELVVRSALGAGWAGLARVVLTESAILGFLGGAAGVAVAYVSLPLLLSLGAEDLPQIMSVAIDPMVLGAAMGTAVMATLLFAIVPVVQLALPRLPLAALHAGGRSMTGERQGNRTRHVLVVAQVAIALVLLVGSGLMIRTFYTLRNVDPGFREPEGIHTFQLTIPRGDAPAAGPAADAARERMLRMQHAIVDRLAAVPGVESAGFSSFNDGRPLDGDGRSTGRWRYVDGREAARSLTTSWELQRVSPGFFETLRTPLVAGRFFDWTDIHNQRQVMLVSENLARTEFGSAGAALGRRLSPDSSEPGAEIVGVVHDVHHNGLNEPAPETAIFPAIATDTSSVVVRSRARVSTADFRRDLHEAVWSVNGTLAPANVRTFGDLYRRAMARPTMTLLLLAITGSVALLLGLIGIYGIVGYAASQRRREIGVRLALGARPGEVQRQFVRRALVLVGFGVVIGLGAAAALTRWMASQLFGVSPLDPSTHLAVALGLVAAGAIASYVSARRGTALDPVTVLKSN